MEILEKKTAINAETWFLEIKCKEDKNDYTNKIISCGSYLKINKDDIKKDGTDWFSNFITKCPVCGTKMLIPSEWIPTAIQYYVNVKFIKK